MPEALPTDRENRIAVSRQLIQTHTIIEYLTSRRALVQMWTFLH